ncbi:MAG: amidase family protein, partial [Coriobacteriia bacterium]|nr:amidase family protein [Coriobacteriia bacterium]
IVHSFMDAEGVTSEVVSALNGALAHLEALGAEIVEVELPNAKAALSAYYVIGPCEAFSNLSRFDSIRYGYHDPASRNLDELYELGRAHGFGAETRRRIMLGSYLLSSKAYSTYYYPAQQVRTLITQDFQRAFEQVDALITPTSPRTAFRLGEVADPMSMYLSDVFTIPINIAGNGGMNLPVGLGQTSGMPVGVQIIGPQFKDENIFVVAAALEACYADIARLAPMAFVEGEEGEDPQLTRDPKSAPTASAAELAALQLKQSSLPNPSSQTSRSKSLSESSPSSQINTSGLEGGVR